jgi:hypothetical protein
VSLDVLLGSNTVRAVSQPSATSDNSRVDAVDEARFWRNVDRSGGPDACWPWTGGLTGYKGYGRFVLWRDGKRSKQRTASRVLLEKVLGRPLREGHCACHRCNNKPCCNPSHLYEGTFLENRMDEVRRWNEYKRVHGFL